MTKLISSIIDDLNEAELATIIEACGYAIRHNTVLSAALSECDYNIPQLQDKDGDFNDDFENITDYFDLTNLAIQCGFRINAISTYI